MSKYSQAMDETYRRGLEVLQKTFQPGQFESMSDLQNRVQSLWEQTLTTIRANTEQFVDCNLKAMQSWGEVLEGLRGSTTSQTSEASR